MYCILEKVILHLAIWSAGAVQGIFN